MSYTTPLVFVMLYYCCCIMEATVLCPSSCQCRGYAVNCSNTLKRMPTLDPGIVELDLSCNNLTELDPEALHGLAKLQDINMSFNGFVFLPVDLFTNTNIYTLNISHCRLESLHPKTLRTLVYLFKLDLRSNKVIRVHVETFARNAELTYLDISNNALSEIIYKTFRYNTKLSTLDLSSNMLSYIHPETFRMQRNLRTLNLSHNLIASLDADLFQNMTHLMKFDFSSNLISHIHPDTMKHSSQLLEFLMKENRLKEIDSRTFANNGRLSVIDLSGNRLEALKDGTFVGNPSLSELDLSRNMIARIFMNAFPAASSIQRIDLSNNKLSIIHPDVLVRIPLKHLILQHNPLRILKGGLPFLRAFHLETLNLEYCNITHLSSSMFSNMVNLKELNLANNMIHRIPINVFEDLQVLFSLDLSKNLLKLVRKQYFEGLSALRLLNVSHNPLKCDSCFMRDFLLWSRNISTVMVNTTCKIFPLDLNSYNCSAEETEEEELNTDLSTEAPNRAVRLSSEVSLESKEDQQKAILTPEHSDVDITSEPSVAATQDISVVLYISLIICSLLMLNIMTLLCILIRKRHCCT